MQLDIKAGQGHPVLMSYADAGKGIESRGNKYTRFDLNDYDKAVSYIKNKYAFGLEKYLVEIKDGSNVIMSRIKLPNGQWLGRHGDDLFIVGGGVVVGTNSKRIPLMGEESAITTAFIGVVGQDLSQRACFTQDEKNTAAEFARKKSLSNKDIYSQILAMDILDKPAELMSVLDSYVPNFWLTGQQYESAAVKGLIKDGELDFVGGLVAKSKTKKFLVSENSLKLINNDIGFEPLQEFISEAVSKGVSFNYITKKYVDSTPQLIKNTIKAGNLLRDILNAKGENIQFKGFQSIPDRLKLLFERIGPFSSIWLISGSIKYRTESDWNFENKNIEGIFRLAVDLGLQEASTRGQDNSQKHIENLLKSITSERYRIGVAAVDVKNKNNAYKDDLSSRLKASESSFPNKEKSINAIARAKTTTISKYERQIQEFCYNELNKHIRKIIRSSKFTSWSSTEKTKFWSDIQRIRAHIQQNPQFQTQDYPTYQKNSLEYIDVFNAPKDSFSIINVINQKISDNLGKIQSKSMKDPITIRFEDPMGNEYIWTIPNEFLYDLTFPNFAKSKNKYPSFYNVEGVFETNDGAILNWELYPKFKEVFGPLFKSITEEYFKEVVEINKDGEIVRGEEETIFYRINHRYQKGRITAPDFKVGGLFDRRTTQSTNFRFSTKDSSQMSNKELGDYEDAMTRIYAAFTSGQTITISMFDTSTLVAEKILLGFGIEGLRFGRKNGDKWEYDVQGVAANHYSNNILRDYHYVNSKGLISENKISDLVASFMNTIQEFVSSNNMVTTFTVDTKLGFIPNKNPKSFTQWLLGTGTRFRGEYLGFINFDLLEEKIFNSELTGRIASGSYGIISKLHNHYLTNHKLNDNEMEQLFNLLIKDNMFTHQNWVDKNLPVDFELIDEFDKYVLYFS